MAHPRCQLAILLFLLNPLAGFGSDSLIVQVDDILFVHDHKLYVSPGTDTTESPKAFLDLIENGLLIPLPEDPPPFNIINYGTVILHNVALAGNHFMNAGRLLIFGHSSLSHNFDSRPGSFIRIIADDRFDGATLTLNNNLENNGTIALINAAGVEKESSLIVTGASFSNESPGIIYVFGGSGGVRRLTGSFVNRGEIILDHTLELATADTLISNASSGYVFIAGGDLRVRFENEFGRFVNEGSLDMPVARWLHVENGDAIHTGSIRNLWHISVPEGTFVNEGRLSRNGHADVAHIRGNFVQNDEGLLGLRVLELNGRERLRIDGTAVFAGTLSFGFDIDLIGQQGLAKMIAYEAFEGAFEAIHGPVGDFFEVAFDPVYADTALFLDLEIIPVATEHTGIPRQSLIVQMYPNPANSHSTVGLTLSEPGEVSLVLYDLLGRRLRVVLDGYVPAGEYSEALDTSHLPAGTYLLRLQTRGYDESHVLTVIR